MPLPIAALGGLAAKGAMGAKGLWAGSGPFMKLMALMFGYDIAKDTLGAATGLTERGTQKMQVELAGKQMDMQASMGRREEERTDKLIRQLTRENEKKYLREEKASARQDVRNIQAEQNEMAMAMVMALSQLGQEQSQIATRPRPSRASMLHLMR